MTTFFEELCSRLNINWGDIGNNDLFSETELVRWLTLAKDEAVSRHSWPFTEGKIDFAATAGLETYDYPTNLKSDSIRYLTVGGKRYQKLLFEDYLNYKEDYPSGTDKYFSDRNRVIYTNYLVSGFGGTIVAYGQVEVTGTVSSSITTTVFSMAEPEGDEAIIKLAYSKALSSDKMKNKVGGNQEKAEAFEILDGIWKRIQERQHTYQTKDRPMFERIDIINGNNYEDESNPLRF